MKMECKYISKFLQLSEKKFTVVLQIDTTVLRIETYFKYEQKKERNYEEIIGKCCGTGNARWMFL